MNDDDARSRALALVELRPHGTGKGVVEWLTRLCQAMSAEFDLLAVTLIIGAPNDRSAVIAANDPARASFAEIEFDVGEGPAQDAWTYGRPVLVPELGESQDGAWPGYTVTALRGGIHAVFAFPLQVGAVRVGVLTAFHDQPRRLIGDELNMCLTMAEVATQRLIHHSSPASDGTPDASLHGPIDHRSEVYQAQGMVAVALGVTLMDALARMRGRAFLSSQELIDVASDVVHNGLRLGDDAPHGNQNDNNLGQEE